MVICSSSYVRERKVAVTALRVALKMRHTHSRHEMQRAHKYLLSTNRKLQERDYAHKQCRAKQKLVGLTTKTAQEVVIDLLPATTELYRITSKKWPFYKTLSISQLQGF